MVDKDNGEFLAVHEEVVKKVLETLPDEEELYDLAELFKVFGDSTRIRIEKVKEKRKWNYLLILLM